MFFNLDQLHFKIGPLFDRDSATDEELFKASLNAGEDEEIYLDIPVIYERAREMVDKYVEQFVFEYARVYLSLVPD